MSTEYKFQEVLDWVNGVRAEHNIGAPLDALPLGQCSSATTCPIARALSTDAAEACVGTVGIDLYEGLVRVDTFPTTPYIAAFITAFDSGAYPELDESTH